MMVPTDVHRKLMTACDPYFFLFEHGAVCTVDGTTQKCVCVCVCVSVCVFFEHGTVCTVDGSTQKANTVDS